MKKLEFYWLFICAICSFTVFSQKVPDLNNPEKYPLQVINQVPDTIEGKPLTYWVNHPNIDQYTKLYIQGKFSVSDNDPTFQILDSINSVNVETSTFYLFVFHKIMDKSDGALSEAVAWTCANYIKSKPCKFFSKVKYGKYKSYFTNWVEFTSYSGLWELESKQQVITQIENKMKLNCSSKFKNDWVELLKTIESYRD